MDIFSSNLLYNLDMYAPMCTHIKVQYGSSEIFPAKNMGAELSVRSGTSTSTKSAKF